MESLADRLLDKYQQQLYVEAINIWSSASLVPTSDPLSSKLAAASFFQTNQYSHAFDLLDQIESCFDQDSSYFSLFGATCRRLGHLTKANTLFLKAIELDPASLFPKNNYANLLIDLKRYEEAQNILEDILTEDPSYEDAVSNLRRLNTLQNTISEIDNSSASDWSPADPLLLSFTTDEVIRTTQPLNSQSPPSDEKLLASELPIPNALEVANDQIKLAVQANIDGNYEFALKICSSMSFTLPSSILSEVYDVAADAYIALKSFSYAEICYYCSGNLSSFTFKTYFNLASICMIRSDRVMAELYISRARSLEPNNPLLSQLEQSFTKSEVPFSFSNKWDFRL